MHVVILGNGVAGDIGCWMEACVARRQIGNAGEMNGFLRPAAPLAQPPMKVGGGAMTLTPDGAPKLDQAALEEVTIQSSRFGRANQATKEAL